MVQPKGKDKLFSRGWLDRLLDDYDEKHPIVATRYYVAEVVPGRNVRIPNGDGHGGTTYDWEGPTETKVSEFYDDEKLVHKFIEEHEPDEGKTLEPRVQHLRRFTQDRWM